MVAYKSNELISSSDLAKKFGKVLGMITQHSVEKIGVLKNNKLEAVVISTEEYERLKELEELVEHQQIFMQIKEREKTPTSEYIDGDEVLKAFNLTLD
jgi:PHD/YefM family antitoxin component YafN of YafNO toxin-antitoxin module